MSCNCGLVSESTLVEDVVPGGYEGMHLALMLRCWLFSRCEGYVSWQSPKHMMREGVNKGGGS